MLYNVYVSRLVLFKTVGNLPKIHHAPRPCQNYAICMHVARNIGRVGDDRVEGGGDMDGGR